MTGFKTFLRVLATFALFCGQAELIGVAADIMNRQSGLAFFSGASLITGGFYALVLFMRALWSK